MTAKKTAKKAARKAVGRPFAKGDARINRTKPGTGRPPNEFKQLCQAMASRQETLIAVTRILADSAHPHFMSALKWASENGYGKPAQPLTGEHGGAVVVKVLRDPDPF